MTLRNMRNPPVTEPSSQVVLDHCPECAAPLEEDFAGTRVGVTVLSDGTRDASDTEVTYERLFCTNGHAVATAEHGALV